IGYLGKTDGSPAVRLGDGAAMALSPDGKWVLSYLFTLRQLILLPTGAGEVKRLERHGIEHYGPGGMHWLPNGKQIILNAREPNRGRRYYLQDIESGSLRPITPEGIAASPFADLNGHVISPDGKFIVASDSQGKKSLYPIEGGEPRPLPGLDDEDEVITWS